MKVVYTVCLPCGPTCQKLPMSSCSFYAIVLRNEKFYDSLFNETLFWTCLVSNLQRWDWNYSHLALVRVLLVPLVHSEVCEEDLISQKWLLWAHLQLVICSAWRNLNSNVTGWPATTFLALLPKYPIRIRLKIPTVSVYSSELSAFLCPLKWFKITLNRVKTSGRYSPSELECSDPNIWAVFEPNLVCRRPVKKAIWIAWDIVYWVLW